MAKPLSKTIGMMLLADGVSALIAPRKYLRTLSVETDVPLIDDIFEYLAENPRLTRSLSVLEVTLGLWLTLR